MRKKSVTKIKRPKALFGALESSAYITGALINAGATTAAAGINAAAQLEGASQQAKSIEQQAESDARALEKANSNSIATEEKNIQANKDSQNRIADEISMLQMNLQQQAGNESRKELAAEGRIHVKCGGIARRMRNGGYDPQYSLTGGGNLPFRVIDGGGVIPRGTTPEGYDLYEIYGDNHEHYHKAQGGKYKSGVGIKFANGGLVEGEGNQGGKQGEYLLVTPDNGYFISKHNINGVNPAGLINRGVNPVDAYNIQEMAKRGNKKFRAGQFLRTAGKYGCRVKAEDGWSVIRDPRLNTDNWIQNLALSQNAIYGNGEYIPYTGQVYDPFSVGSTLTNQQLQPVETTGKKLPALSSSVLAGLNAPLQVKEPVPSNNTVPYSDNNSFWNSPKGALAINTAANFAGAGINYLGNLMGQHKLSSAYNNAARLMSNAYANLKEVDVNSLGLNDINQWRSAQYLPAIRSANYNVNPQLQDIKRSELRQNEAVGNTTLSSAARNNRMQDIAQTAQENRSKVYADQANREEEIKQKNNQMINEAASRNIQASNQLRQNLASIRADLAKYNNDIANQRILGPAQIQSEMGINRANAKANAYLASSDAFSDALTTSGNNYYKFKEMQYKSDMDYLNSLALGTPQAQVNSLIFRKAAGYNIDDKYVRSVYANASPEEKKRLEQAFPTYNLGRYGTV